MKKYGLIAFFLIVALLLSPAVFAEGEKSVKSITVTVEPPVKDTPVSVVVEDMVKILVETESGERTLSAGDGEFVLDEDSGWYESGTEDRTKLEDNDFFISGRNYRLVIKFKIFVPSLAPEAGKTSLYINNKSATLSTQEDWFVLEGAFVCTHSEIAPKVSVETEGELEKVFDGKETVLTAKVEKLEGVEYSYAWYMGETLLEKETGESIKLRNVAQSGLYSCHVSATVSDDPDGETVVTKSLPYTVNITPLPVVIQIENAEKNLFDADPAFTYTVMGELFDPVEGSLVRREGEDLGVYEITPGTFGVKQEFAGNYELEIRNGTLTVLSAGELPFSAVANLADLSYINGKSGAHIRVSASKGALPEGAMVSLHFPAENVTLGLAGASSQPILKSFTLSATDAKGKTVTMPKHGALRLYIPLTEEEEKQKTETITAAFYDGTAKKLDCKVLVEDGVTYMVVETRALGSIALYEGEKVAAPQVSETPPQPKENDRLWIWILVSVASLLAIGGIAFTVWWTVKNRKKTETTKVWPPQKEETKPDAEKERIRTIADEINAMPPIPEPTEEKKEEPKQEKKTISFEDLEN